MPNAIQPRPRPPSSAANTCREALRGIFMAVANHQRPSAADLDVLNANLAATLPHARLVLDETHDVYEWGWAGTDLNSPLWPIVRSAADVLTSEQERPLVRECGARRLPLAVHGFHQEPQPTVVLDDVVRQSREGPPALSARQGAADRRRCRSPSRRRAACSRARAANSGSASWRRQRHG